MTLIGDKSFNEGHIIKGFRVAITYQEIKLFPSCMLNTWIKMIMIP